MLIMNVLVYDTSKEEQNIDTKPRITAAQPFSGSGLLSEKEGQVSGKFNVYYTFYKERSKVYTYFHIVELL